MLQDGHSQEEPHLQTVEQHELPLVVFVEVGLGTIGAGTVFLEQQDMV